MVPDVITFGLSAIALLLSVWASHHAGRANSAARKQWAARAKTDPEAVAVIMGRLGWMERRRLAKEINRLNEVRP